MKSKNANIIELTGFEERSVYMSVDNIVTIAGNNNV
jgi:hypothetical protein